MGAAASYGALYLLTGFGVLILGTCLFAGLALPAIGGRRWPGILGLLAGPGVFLLHAASLSGDAAMGIAGGAILAAALVAYAAAGRALCARGASPM